MPAAAQAAGLPSRLGKYELLMPLAAGGMARIYIGRATGIGQFERHVVLKMITPEKANDQTSVNMFLDEARLAASLNHQNVAQVFEVGEEGGIHYLAMEYVHGQDLRALLAKAGSAGTRIPVDLALTVVAGAAAGLNHAHERRGPDGVPLGIVHRDVSPSNIMIGYDGAVKLLDFGIAKATQRSVETQSGIIKGKFAYMAPEQCRGRDVDRRSDVFSLGIILYEITTQHRCFRADSDFDTMHRIVTGDVVRPSRIVPGYPQALEAIVLKALATDPAQRYQSAGLLLEALESFAIASRMSLSTMGLGRFMRDMFGDVQEPWLNASMRMATVTPPKENTISSTGAADRSVRNQQSTTPNPLHAPAPVELDDDIDGPEAAKTLLQLPRDGKDPFGLGLDDPAVLPASQPVRNWNGTPGGGFGHGTRHPTPVPGQVAAGTQPLPGPDDLMATAPQLPPRRDGSHSHPAVPVPPMASVPLAPGMPAAGIASTKHGYASAAMSRADVSYPRYEPPVDAYSTGTAQVLRPNRRPLFIGLGIVIAGIIVMMMVTLGGSSEPESAAGSAASAAHDEVVAPPPKPSPAPAPAPVAGSAETVDDAMVSIVIHSDPEGADVLIAGVKIGTTPFEKRVARGTKVQQLTVRKDGFVDFNGKIDLGGEYENKNIKLVPVGEEPAPPEPAAAPPEPAPVSAPAPAPAPAAAPAAPKATPVTTPRTTPAPTTAPKKKQAPKCQPPGPNVDPFGLPVCKS